MEAIKLQEWREWIETIIKDKEQIRDFFDLHEESIRNFILEKWNEYSNNQENKPKEIAFEPQEDDFSNDTTSLEEELQKEEKELPMIKFESSDTENSTEKAEKPEGGNNAKYEHLQAQMKAKHLTFPNGRVNQEYGADFDPDDSFPWIENVELEGLDAIGLHYDADKKRIAGIPSKAGDHKISMKYSFKDWEEGKPRLLEKEITLIINPDPRSLWNTIETPHEIEYYKPDSDKQFLQVIPKKTGGFLGIGKKEQARKDMVAASQRGRSHAHEGKPRDDDFKLFFDDNSEWYVLVVADGAGSVKYSREGSRIACETVIEVCKQQLSLRINDFEKSIQIFNSEKSQENRNGVGKILYEIIGNAAFKAYKNIKAEADSKSAPVKDYSTTLLLSICKKFEFGWFVGAFWVGDGGIGIYNKETSFLKVLGDPDGGEFAGQTRFLTMPEITQPAEIYRRLRFDTYPDFTALILMTDGVTDPKFETDANLNRVEKWHDLWKDLSENVDFSDDNEQSADQLLEWLDFWSPGNHDDRTIAILF
jgi:serine/threonine protein phosphatase PrpC